MVVDAPWKQRERDIEERVKEASGEFVSDPQLLREWAVSEPPHPQTLAFHFATRANSHSPGFQTATPWSAPAFYVMRFSFLSLYTLIYIYIFVCCNLSNFGGKTLSYTMLNFLGFGLCVCWEMLREWKELI